MSDNYEDRDELAKRMGFDSWEAYLNSGNIPYISEEEAKEKYLLTKSFSLGPNLKTNEITNKIIEKLERLNNDEEKDLKRKYHSKISVPKDIIIHDIAKFANLCQKNSEELIQYRKENLRGLNEPMIALIDPEYYEAVRMIPSARQNGNAGILPTQKSIRWREMNDEDILRLKLLVHPYSTLSDLAPAANKDFIGEHAGLYSQIAKRRLQERIENEANLDSLLERELQIDNVPTHFYN